MQTSLRGMIRHTLQGDFAKPWRHAYYARLLRHLVPEQDALVAQQYVSPGDVVLDLGANVGVYTKVLSDKVGPNGQVHAVEPIPATFACLLNSVQKLGLRNVFCYNVAASNKTGLGHATVPEYTDGGANFYQARLSNEGINVRTYSVDDLFPDLNPAFVKCDVEDRELDVIKGARNMIERCHPVWHMEVCLATEDEVLKIMDGYGYTSKKLQHNWLFVPRHSREV
jgi:FkbM family methyltransferase